MLYVCIVCFLDDGACRYGSVVPVSGRDPSKFQHQGFGMLLMEEAERIATEEHGSHKISVISGTHNTPKLVLKQL